MIIFNFNEWFINFYELLFELPYKIRLRIDHKINLSFTARFINNITILNFVNNLFLILCILFLIDLKL